MKKENPNQQIQPSDMYSEVDMFMENENHCCLCGNALQFAHSFDYLEQTLVEKALCPQCNVQMREQTHTLH